MRLVVCTTPEEIRLSQRLRFQVYCVEKGWIDPATCEGGIEADEYDADAVHFLVMDDAGDEVLGTSRLLLGEKVELPAARFIDLEAHGVRPTETVEVSRLAARRASRSQNLAVFLAMTQAMYEWTHTHGVKSWMSIADVGVFLLMKRVGMPVIAAGEKTDYLGSLCVPSLLDVEGTGAILLERGFDARVA